MNEPTHSSVSARTTLVCEIVESTTTLTLGQLSRSCGMDVGWITRLVDEGVLEPVNQHSPDRRWYFPTAHLARARTAARLHRDLSINVAGLALALDLLDEISSLRDRLDAAQERSHTNPQK